MASLPIAPSFNRLTPGLPTQQVAAQVRPAKIAFVLHDAGETKAMLPVMQTLDRDGIDYKVLADSTAASLLAGNPHRVTHPDQLKSVQCVLTGLVSNFQKSWSQFFRQTHRQVVGYYDGFTYDTTQNRLEDFIGTLTSMITPSRDTANFFEKRFKSIAPQQPPIPIVALGQPVLEATSQAVQQTKSTTLAGTLGIDFRQPTLLFVGGAGSGYAEAFQLFCDTVKNIPNANILLSLHPKADGALESQLIQQNQLQGRIKIIPKSIDTTQLLALKPIVLSQDSTFATQAVLQGQKLILIGSPVTPEATNFNPLTFYRIAPRVKDPLTLATTIQQAIGTKNVSSDVSGLYALFGIPQQATSLIVNYLKSQIAPQNSNPAQAA